VDPVVPVVPVVPVAGEAAAGWALTVGILA
jgi:hypothetical protein